jgi:NAD-dependent histone deacetylase SIR2
MVDSSCPRVLINLERVGNFGSRSDDVILIGKCDEIVRNLCRKLGWEEELDKLWVETEASVLTEPIERPEGEGASGDTKVDGEQPEEAKTKALLESIEAGLAKIAIAADGERKQPATKVNAHEPTSTASAAEEVAKEASSAIKDDVKKDDSSSTN